jgi:type IV pilus assembly protein PilE
MYSLPKKLHQCQSGFTLVELMVSLVIIAILTAVVIPSYNNQVMKGYRSDAIAELGSIMNAQERYYTDKVTYTNDLSKLGLTISSSGYYVTRDGRYYIYARKCGSMPLTQCVELEAKAQGKQVNDGNLKTNTLGTSVRILTDNSEVNW